MWTEKNPFLLGPYEPLVSEYVIRDASIEGHIPRELNGALYRTGTNQHFRPADPDRFHWFDGDGATHAFRLQDGRASYYNRLVETDGLKAELRAGRALYNGFFGRGKPQPPLPAGAPESKGVAGVNVITIAGRVLGLHELNPFYWDLDPYTLETRGKFAFDGRFDAMLTAHPHLDHHTGEFLFYALDNERLTLDAFAAAPDGSVLWSHRIALPFSTFLHDFIFTEHYLIFALGPIRFNPLEPGRVAAGRSAWSLDAEAGLRLCVVDRATGTPRWFQTDDAFTVDHYLNAYEQGRTIVFDATVTNTLRRVPGLNVDDFFPFPLVDEPTPFSGPELWRIVVDLAAGTLKHERVGDYNAEFVRPNEAVMGRAHRYGYMAGIHAPRAGSKGFNVIIKHDYATGRSVFQRLSANYDMMPGEPIFVPREGATVEDDGWILNVWTDPRRNASEMTIFAAQDFEGEPVARVRLDHHVPIGFHGNWISDAALLAPTRPERSASPAIAVAAREMART
jgi:carotenoid cleavage dioxygenase